MNRSCLWHTIDALSSRANMRLHQVYGPFISIPVELLSDVVKGLSCSYSQ